MPLAAAAARSPSQFGRARASGTSSSICCRSSIAEARRAGAAAEKKNKKKRRTSASSSIGQTSPTPLPLHPNPNLASRSVALRASNMDSPSPLYLGIDMGTSGGRAMVIDGERGVFFLSSSRSLFLQTSRPAHSLSLVLQLSLSISLSLLSSSPSFRRRHRRRLGQEGLPSSVFF